MKDEKIIKNAVVYASRGSTKAANACRYLIEGEPVTIAQIAGRLGILPDRARRRLGELKKEPGAITWARLRV